MGIMKCHQEQQNGWNNRDDGNNCWWILQRNCNRYISLMKIENITLIISYKIKPIFNLWSQLSEQDKRRKHTPDINYAWIFMGTLL